MIHLLMADPSRVDDDAKAVRGPCLARELAREHGLPVGRGSGVLSSAGDETLRAAEAIGYPVLVKPAAGGGGIGMLPARNEGELLAAV